MHTALHWTPYGRPAADTLHARLSEAKRDDPLAPVTVLVPTNFVGVSLRRLLASGELGPVGASRCGVTGLTLLTVRRLAELLGAPRLGDEGRRPVSVPVTAAAVRAELAADPGVFAGVRDHPATEEALVHAHRELAAVRPATLERLAEGTDRARDVIGMHHRVSARLAADWYDEVDLMTAATTAVGEAPELAADIGVVLVYLPQRLELPAAALLRALGDRVPVEVIAATTGSAEADADVVRGLERLGLDPASATVAPVPASAPRAPVPASAPVAPDPASDPAPAPASEQTAGSTEVIVASDPDDEVRACVRVVVDAARAGTPLERIAVLYPAGDPYARLLSERLDAAGVARNGRAVRPLADRLAGRWLTDALDLPARDFSRAAVLDLLACTPRSGGGGCRYPLARYERVSREAGVVGGADWHERLEGHAQRLRAKASEERAAEDPREWLAERLEREAAAADGLGVVVGRLRRQVGEGHGLRSWADLSSWARRLLAEHCGDERARESWPRPERDASARVESTLDRLATLDAVEPEPTLAVFRRTLELELHEDLGRDGRFGEGVLVGDLSAGVGIDLDLVIVCGLAEGVLPGPVREDSLLPDAERADSLGELEPRAARVHAQRRQLAAALASGRRRLLAYPRGDLRRSVERPPSRWLLELVADLPGERPASSDGGPDLSDLPSRAPWLRRIASFDAGLRRAAPATEQEYRLRALSERRAARQPIDDHPLVRDDEALTRALELHRARAAKCLTRFDGDLSDLPDVRELVGSPAGGERPIAPTRLQAYARCPHAYLLEHVLRVEPVELPEEQLEISALDLGSLVHEILDRWLREVLDDPPRHGAPYALAHRRRLAEVAEACCEEYVSRGLTGHPRLWAAQRERLLRDLELLCERDEGHRRDGELRPLGTEMAFGLDGEPPVGVTLPDGREVRFRGVLDRLDEHPSGGLVVTDYKTGSGKDDEYRWLEGDPVARGRLLQLPVYALAARRAAGEEGWVRAQYWFCTSKGGFRRRVVDLDAGAERRFQEVLGTLVAGIEAGLFPALPPPEGGKPFVECAYCDPDALGTAERRRVWERKRGEPRLADLLAVVEPEEDAP